MLIVHIRMNACVCVCIRKSRYCMYIVGDTHELTGLDYATVQMRRERRKMKIRLDS